MIKALVVLSVPVLMLVIVLYSRYKNAKLMACCETIPPDDDAARGYKEMVRVLMKRVDAVSGLSSCAGILNKIGLPAGGEMMRFYPVISFIRLCHFAGYEVVLRKRTEHPADIEERPEDANELVCRLRDEYFSDH